MSTHELRRFRIDCDWHYDGGCSRFIVIQDAADSYAAESDARLHGWKITLSAGCPHCVTVAARSERMAR